MEYTCPRCLYTTKNRFNIIRHIDRKKLCNQVKLDIKPQKYKEIITNNKNSIQFIEYLLKVKELENKLKNVNVNLKNYNSPNLDYIGPKDYISCMKDIDTAYLKMYKMIYFNPMHPENNSIRKTNKKDKFIELYKDGKWITSNVDTVLSEIKDIIYEALDKGCNDDRLVDLGCRLDYDEKFRIKVDRDILATSLIKI